MLFFQKLFAVYYLLLIKIRRNKILKNLNRGGEEFGAMLLVVCSQFYLICIVIWVFKGIIGFDMPTFANGLSVLQRILVIAVILIWFYAGYRYFLTKRERRNKFIDEYRKMHNKEQIIWKIIAIGLLLTPIWFLIGIIWFNYF